MVKQAVVNVYQYDELSDEGKAKARHWWRDGLSTDFDGDNVLSDFAEVAKALNIEVSVREERTHRGTTVPKMCVSWEGEPWRFSFDGSWRAEGFDARNLYAYAPQDAELNRIAEKLKGCAERANAITAESDEAGLVVFIRRVQRYRTDLEFETECDDERMQSIVDDVKGSIRDLCAWAAKSLENEWEYQNSDECVADNIRLNEYEFTESGERFTLPSGGQFIESEIVEEAEAEQGVGR